MCCICFHWLISGYSIVYQFERRIKTAFFRQILWYIPYLYTWGIQERILIFYPGGSRSKLAMLCLGLRDNTVYSILIILFFIPDGCVQ